MSVFHETIKQILSDVENFLNEALKNEKKLAKSTIEQKQKILEKIASFYIDNPSMKLLKQDTVPSPEDERSISGGSGNTDEGEEGAYIDQGVAIIAAADLKEATHSGYLEKKQKKGIFGAKFQKRWCVIQKGVMYYYTKPEDKKQNGSFRLEGYQFRLAPELSSRAKEKELAFEVLADGDKRTYQFIAPSKDEFDGWRNLIENGGQLIEEDLYEEVQPELPPPPPVQDVDLIQEDVYEETETESVPPPPGPTPTPAPEVPPALPPSVPGRRQPPLPPPPEPEPIQEDIYDDGTSPLDDTPASPLPPPPPPTRRLPDIPLPPVPTAGPPKKKIKINITCSPETDFENRYFCKWDCTADATTELTFKQGDIIYIISKEFDSQAWWIGENKGNFGLVPKNYLVPAFEMAS